MNLIDYRTNETIRTLSPDEEKMYMDMIRDDKSQTGVVCGSVFGHDGPVWAEG